MTALAAIKEALSPLGIEMHPDVYTGSKTEYITYNYADDHGADWGDNLPGAARTSVQVHYVCPINSNFIATRNRIRRALAEADFSYPSIAYQDTDKLRHMIFECEFIEEA